MSCHDIGRGMNSVTKAVLAMYENNELTREAAIKVMRSCKDGTGWCDGIPEEAVAYLIDNGICGCCLKQREQAVNLGDYLGNISDFWMIDDNELIATPSSLCPDCAKKILRKYQGRIPLKDCAMDLLSQ